MQILRINLYSMITVQGEQKRFKHLVGYGIKSMWPIFKTKMLHFDQRLTKAVKVYNYKSSVEKFRRQNNTRGSSPNYRLAFIRIDTNSIVYVKRCYTI